MYAHLRPETKGEILPVVIGGEYGLVQGIKGSVGDHCSHKAEHLLSGKGRMELTQVLEAIFSGRAPNFRSFDRNRWRGHYVVAHGAIGSSDFNDLPKGNNTKDLRSNAESIGYVVYAYNRSIGARQGSTYRLGAILSDMLQVLPTEVAAKSLMAMSNPDISTDIEKGQFNGQLKGINLQIRACEAVSLLPTYDRHRIFEKWAQMDPGISGSANRFLSFIISNFELRASVYSGAALILKNFEGDKYGGLPKVQETRSDFATIRQLIKDQGGDWSPNKK